MAILGANGAGKTTVLRAVSGTVETSGEIVFDGRRIARHPPESIARLGIAHVPEGRGIYAELSVRENVLLGGVVRRDRKAVKADITRALEYFPRIAERAKQQAGMLSGGEQQMLALARALVSRPRLLLLDEPSLGLAPIVVGEFFRVVRTLNQEEGMTVLVVEQNAKVVLASTQYGYVLEVGRVALHGTSEELRDTRACAPRTWATDGELLPVRRRSGSPTEVSTRPSRSHRADPPRDRDRQLRPGRDGHVRHLHRLVFDLLGRDHLLALVRADARACVRRRDARVPGDHPALRASVRADCGDGHDRPARDPERRRRLDLVATAEVLREPVPAQRAEGPGCRDERSGPRRDRRLARVRIGRLARLPLHAARPPAARLGARARDEPLARYPRRR